MDLLRQLLPVLGFIHTQRVIHRDLKPGNIIRDRHHSKLVLIDFGSVKEIQPQVADEGSLTISIAIQALTNIHPRYLPVDESTGNLLWQDLVTASPALVRVLTKMVAYHFKDRYQSATAAPIDLP